MGRYCSTDDDESTRRSLNKPERSGTGELSEVSFSGANCRTGTTVRSCVIRMKC